MIGDPFERLRNRHQMETAADRTRPLNHVTGKLAMELLVQLINFLIARNQRTGLGGVAMHKGIHCAAQHLERNAGHLGNVHVRLQLGFQSEFNAAPADRGRFADLGLITDDAGH